MGVGTLNSWLTCRLPSGGYHTNRSDQMWGVSFALSRGAAVPSDLTFNCSSLSAGQVEHLILKVLLLTVAWLQSRGMAESSQDLIMTLFRQHWTFKSRKKEKKKQATFHVFQTEKIIRPLFGSDAAFWTQSCFTFIALHNDWREWVMLTHLLTETFQGCLGYDCSLPCLLHASGTFNVSKFPSSFFLADSLSWLSACIFLLYINKNRHCQFPFIKKNANQT